MENKGYRGHKFFEPVPTLFQVFHRYGLPQWRYPLLLFERRSNRVNFLPQFVEKAVFQFLEDLATPRSLSVFLLLKHGEWTQLAEMRIDPQHYCSAESYWRDCQATELLRKYKKLPAKTDAQKAKVALDNFWSCERQCLSSNIRLERFLMEPALNADPFEMRVRGVLSRTRKIVQSILGPAPSNVEGRFGPGATYGDRGALVTVPDKMSSNPTLTSDSWNWLVPWTGTLWAKASAENQKAPQFVRGNRFTTVPKDALKDRGIAVEPSINLFFQLGLGRVLKSRLRAAGLDLAAGQEKHRALARSASITGRSCTMDLSNASDTICKTLVKLLLPSDWFTLLSELRSPFTLVEGNWVFLDKFSSMGNGFTFELETLIFSTLISALTGCEIGRELFVFGDDIICPSDHSKDVIALLEFLGFSVNERKTFVDGPFRESCGGDFFLGVDVRPHYLVEEPCEPQQLISLMNGLRSRAREGLRWLDIRRCWMTLLGALPSQVRRCRGPEVLGDLCIHDERDRWSTRWRFGIRYLLCYAPQPYLPVKLGRFAENVILALSTYEPHPRFLQDDGNIALRGAVGGFRLKWVPYS